MSDDNVIELHDRITVTFSPEISKLIRAEIEWQRRKYPGRKLGTAEEFVSEQVKFWFEAMALSISRSR